MDKIKGNQRNREYKDYGGNPGCQGCEVFDLISCPLVERAYDRGIKIKTCYFAREFGERIIAMTSKEDKRRRA